MNVKVRLGWVRDLPDVRDYRLDFDKPKGFQLHNPGAVLKLPENATPAAALAALPVAVDNRKYASQVKDQLDLGSCTANAAAALLEYMENRGSGRHIDVSRLFIYKVTRNLMGLTGDSGADIRTTLKTLAMVGAPPESNWPYKISAFDKEPSAMLYALAANYKAVSYARLDSPTLTKPGILTAIKTALSKTYAVQFGFSVYSSFGNGPNIPFPSQGDMLEGGHSTLIVGYDDNRIIGSCKGALLFENSWNVTWGDKGYGYLPYEYVLQGLADDFWTIYNQAWIDTGVFN